MIDMDVTMNDMLLFQIQARNIDPEIVVSKLGETKDFVRSENSCIWHYEIEAPPGHSSFPKMAMQVIDKFSDQKEFLLSLRENGSDLTFLWFPVPRKGFYTLGITHKLMKELVSYGIALNCPYFEHRPSEVNVNPV
jgi:hypothetical protein